MIAFRWPPEIEQINISPQKIKNKSRQTCRWLWLILFMIWLSALPLFLHDICIETRRLTGFPVSSLLGLWVWVGGSTGDQATQTSSIFRKEYLQSQTRISGVQSTLQRMQSEDFLMSWFPCRCTHRKFCRSIATIFPNWLVYTCNSITFVKPFKQSTKNIHQRFMTRWLITIYFIRFLCHFMGWNRLTPLCSHDEMNK